MEDGSTVDAVPPPERRGARSLGVAADIHARVLAHVRDSVMVTESAPLRDPGPRIVYVNPAFTQMTGWAAEEVLDRTPRLLQGPETDPVALERINRALAAGKRVREELVNRRRDGSTFWVELDISPLLDDDGTTTHFVAVQRDITSRKALERRREQRRHLDPLTGLLNRRGFDRELSTLLARPPGVGPGPALMLCDVRGLRAINATYGRTVGDQVLQELAGRLSSLEGPSSFARLDDGEYAVLFEDCELLELITAAERLRRLMLLPVRLPARELTVSMSCGMTWLVSGRTPTAVLREADLALRTAKDRGGAQYEFFEPLMLEREHHQLELEQGLRLALSRSELHLVHQPIVRLSDRRLAAAEALLRWRPARGPAVGPADFIPVAEHSGLIVSIGTWVLGQACRDALAWQDRLPGVSVSVNLSPRQLSDPRLLDDVDEALDRGLPPELLTLEITESALLDDPDAATVVLRRLRHRGVCLALDDFGTGYSSLSYLTRLPVHSIKIDKTFVDEIEHDQAARAVVRAVVALARDVGSLRVVAEGIETEEQCRILRELGCQDGQGYLFARPGPTIDLERLPVAVD